MKQITLSYNKEQQAALVREHLLLFAGCTRSRPGLGTVSREAA